MATTKKKNPWLVLSGLFGFIVCLPLLIRLLSFVWGLAAFNYIYSEGDRVGQVVRLSHRGFIWKTDEGTMGLTQSGAYVAVWNFSIDPQNPNKDEIVKELAEARDTGNFVKLHYIQHGGALPWRGQTSDIVDSVTIVRELRR